jgi:site-specific recombinase XerD
VDYRHFTRERSQHCDFSDDDVEIVLFNGINPARSHHGRTSFRCSQLSSAQIKSTRKLPLTDLDIWLSRSFETRDSFPILLQKSSPSVASAVNKHSLTNYQGIRMQLLQVADREPNVSSRSSRHITPTQQSHTGRPRIGLQDACGGFMGHCRTALSLSKHSLLAYESDLNEAINFIGPKKQLRSIDKDQLRAYLKYMRSTRQLKESTIKRRLAILKLLFKWAIQDEVIKFNPFDSLNERIRLPKRLPRALDRGDLALLMKALSKPTKVGDFEEIRNKAATHLLLTTGIRVGELSEIRTSDLSISNESIVIHGKGNRQRLVYLTLRSVRRVLEKYIVNRDKLRVPTDRLFVSIDGKPFQPSHVRPILAEIAKRAQLSRHVTPHMLRHTCATYWLEAGLDIRYVQKLLGHHSISTTEIYTHVSDQSLREALARAAGGLKR